MEQTTTTTDNISVAIPVSTGQIKHENTLYAEPLAIWHGFPITNSLVTSWVAVFVIVILSIVLRMKMKKIPGKLQHFFEYILEGGFSLSDQVTGNRAVTEKVFPFAISIFFFVLVNNWLGILPFGGFGLVQTGADGSTFVPFLRSGTADLNTTLLLALVSVVASNIFGVIVIGAWKAFNKYFNISALIKIFKKIKEQPTILLEAPVMFFVGLLEFIGEFAKIASLSFRLFGNVFAGEVLLASMSAILAYGLPIPFLFLEVVVGFIQALIFSMLTLVYFTIASQDHEGHDEHEKPDDMLVEAVENEVRAA